MFDRSFRSTEYFFLEKGNELVESTKEAAHDVSAKAKDLEKSAEHKLAEATKAGKEKTLCFGFVC